MTRVAVGRDIESDALLGFATGYAGTAFTSPTTTSVTVTGVNIPVNSVVGRVICTGTVFGIIQSNTSATNSVVTVDRWYDATAAMPANINTAAAATPSTGNWVIPPGNAPGAYIALTATTTAAVDGDTALTGEINTANTAGLIRQLGTYAHTAAGTTSTLIKTFTTTATDSLPVTVAQIAVFQGVVLATSRMIFRTVFTGSATATVSSIGDQIQVTETVTL